MHCAFAVLQQRHNLLSQLHSMAQSVHAPAAAQATSLGLASRALDLPLSAQEAGDGLVPPAVAVHIMGKGGAGLMLIMLFMAVTSTGSAEQIAVSSLFSYDVYATYINKNATGKQVRTLCTSRCTRAHHCWPSGTPSGFAEVSFGASAAAACQDAAALEWC